MATATKKAGSKKTEVAQIKKTEVLASVGGMSIGGVANQIAKTQVEIAKTLADVGTQVSAALATLETVNSAIEVKREELKTLHGIEAAALTLDDLNGTIQQTRDEWAAEQERQEAVADEVAAAVEKARKRDEDEYAYKTAQAQRAATDLFAAQQAAALKAEADRKEKLEKEWAAREGELKGRENELAALRQAVEAYPARLKAEVDREVAIATNSLKKTLEAGHALAAKDAETNLKIAQHEKAALAQEIARLQGTITSLHTQLDAAHKSAQTVAEKALDSASGRSAMEALQNSLNRSDAAPATGGRR